MTAAIQMTLRGTIGGLNNHVLKGAADKEEMSTVEFISLSKSLALNQRQEVIRAVLKSGEYQLKEIFSSIQGTGDRWYQISNEQKMRHLKKVMETPVTKSREDSTDHPLNQLHLSRSSKTIHNVGCHLGDGPGASPYSWKHICASFR